LLSKYTSLLYLYFLPISKILNNITYQNIPRFFGAACVELPWASVQNKHRLAPNVSTWHCTPWQHGSPTPVSVISPVTTDNDNTTNDALPSAVYANWLQSATRFHHSSHHPSTC